MKLTLRPEWRLRPFSSFLGFLDIKTGVTVALLFAVLNKVAGVYGLIAALTGAGGSAAQLSMYLYSVVGLIALVWGLRAIAQEDAKHTLYFAHVFFADHVISTAWLVFFAVIWWVYTPHDGRRMANSPAQQEVADSGAKLAGKHLNMTKDEIAYSAMSLWNKEKGLATAVIVLGWFAKIYFALLLYSYAIHLRKGSYRSLPRSRQPVQQHQHSASYIPTSALASGGPDEEEEADDFYRLPLRSAPVPLAHSHSRNASNSFRGGHFRSSSGAGSSISSFADFVSAPGRGRKLGGGASGSGNGNGNNHHTSSSSRGVGLSNLNPASSSSKAAGNATTSAEDVDEVLFDEDEMARRDESASASASGESPDEDRVPLIGAAPSSSSRGRGRKSGGSRV
ncbi:hypothetical protein NLI96_g764 [Meripilus lineatus]|uniref:DUF1753-domain-containing protein n=1 Tax=Meripilus lineatus TaxID=2056292 RepID=A0AAD5VHE8_9APHY|nr:hypothetical protein NLI96_g764 [Physisporinus lineatus]